ncbi:MAG: DUF6531 domain-containing protein [Nitrospiraceae bacterium]
MKPTTTWLTLLLLGTASVASLLTVPLVQAQNPTDFFLHGTGPDNNPPTLFLDTTAPTATTAKFRDSTSVNFSGGNLWKVIGTWPAQPTLTAGTLTALSDLHVWLGLKNSDDQGTQFDLRAEVFKNGALVSSGLTRCITGITRNPANAMEATVAFGSFSSVTFNGTTDTLSLKISTRIGTNPDNTKCPGHNNAVGLRLYFDATTRNARFDATIAAGQAPTISSFTPASGRATTTVTVTGTNFTNVTTVTFNGVAAASFTVQNATTLTAVVPTTATTGPLAVTTAGGTATSTGHFVVIPTQDMQLSVLPATATVPAMGQAFFKVSLTGSGGFTNLATLAVTGFPAGMTATFGAATLTAGQSTLLTVATNGTVPAGNVPLTVTATGLANGVSTTRSVSVTVQVQAAGVTSLTGQVLDEDAKPVQGALVKLGTLQATTDEGGNFLILNPPTGADQLLFIDGGPASTPGRSLPIVPYKVTIVAGQANTLGFTPKLHFQKTTGLVDISNTAVQRVVTDPDIPGFQMTIPAGATITGWDGQPNTQISIRRVPIDRTPLPPLPGDLYSPSVYMDYFGKQGGGTPSEPIPITFPNDLDLPPGTQVELWFYDEAPDGSRPNQWAQYGTGTISSDGSQVVPDINPATGKPFGQPRFCCGAAQVARNRAARKPIDDQRGGQPTSGTTGGDPVDLATGIFVLQKTDLVLPGRLPVVFTRRYRTNGATAGPFGPGTSHPYHILLLLEGNLRTLLLPEGARLAFPLQADGKFRNTTDPSVRGAVLTDAGTSLTLRFKDGTTWTFGTPVFSTAFLISQADRNGNMVTLTRSGTTQNLTTITASDGRQLTLAYDGANRIVQITDPLSRSLLYSYDAGGQLAAVVDPAGGVTRYTYDGAGRMLTITDARGITFLTNEYDSEGRVIRQTQADSGIWQFAYTTTTGIITQTTVTDPRGNVTTTRFNGQRYVLSQADALGQATASTRDPASNLLLATTDPLGRKTTFEYDTAGNITKITDPDNKVMRFEYDAVFNRVTKIIDALNQVTEFTYDPANGNLLTVKDPLNHVTTISYNSFGQPLTVTDPLGAGHTTTFAYDAQGNLITTTDPLGNATQRAYDTVSRLISLTDPRGLFTQFRYDDLNRVTEIADARQGITRFDYDPNGNLLTVADAKNQTTTYTYDPMDRLKTRKDALNRTETYDYDGAGNLTQFTDRKSQVSQFSYDKLNRRTNASYQDTSTTTFTYDAVGRLTRTVDSVSGAIELGYDNLDRLTLELTSQGAVTYQYDALGRRTVMTVGGQAPVAYQYDGASRLTQVAQGTLTVGLGYDAAGRRTSLTYPNGTNTTYTYDNANRLTRILHQGPGSTTIEDLTYKYDAAGNRITLTRANGSASLLPAAVASATYDAANEQTQFGSATLAYDANGNLTNDGTNTYTWDARNRLVGISGGATASFVYDSVGRRTNKTINGVATQFLYDGNDIVQEIQSGVPVATYLRSLNIDEMFGILRQDGTYFSIYDGLGSTLALTNQAGTSPVQYTYEPFGKTQSSNPAFANPFQFTGRENDQTALYYYRARYHSPLHQRFLSEDPLNIAAAINLRSTPSRQFDSFLYSQLLLRDPRSQHPYQYVSNNPLLFIDPSGWDKKEERCKNQEFWKELSKQLEESGKWAMYIGTTLATGGYGTGFYAQRGIPRWQSVPGDPKLFRLNVYKINLLSNAGLALMGAGAIDFTAGVLMYGTGQLIEDALCQ